MDAGDSRRQRKRGKTSTIQLHIITVKPLVQAGGKPPAFFARKGGERMKGIEIAVILLSCGVRLLEILDED